MTLEIESTIKVEKKKKKAVIKSEKPQVKEVNPASELKVGIAYPAFFSSFQEFFPTLEVVKPYSSKQYDLIIFSGGEDIDPSTYGARDQYCYGTNKERDNAEYNIFKRYFGKTKILGVCRGHQLLHILNGARMLQDIVLCGYKGHYSGHGLTQVSDPMRNYGGPDVTFTKVNSLHHQGIANPGSGFISFGNYEGIVELSYSPSKEAVTTQFHPEWMGEDGKNFFNAITAWVLKGRKQPNEESKGDVDKKDVIDKSLNKIKGIWDENLWTSTNNTEINLDNLHTGTFSAPITITRRNNEQVNVPTNSPNPPTWLFDNEILPEEHEVEEHEVEEFFDDDNLDDDEP